MGLFRKKKEQASYDSQSKRPVIKCSICTGEQVAGFQDIHNGTFEDIMLIRGKEDLKSSGKNMESRRMRRFQRYIDFLSYFQYDRRV